MVQTTMEIRKNNLQKEKKLFNYGWYSSAVYQFFLIVLVFSFAGWGIDKYLQFKIPIFTILFAIASIVLAMYLMIKKISKK